MKWLAVIAFVLASLARFAWHSSFGLAIRLNATTHRGYDINIVLFWILLLIGFGLSVGAFARRAR
jgi:hypothetical protein